MNWRSSRWSSLGLEIQMQIFLKGSQEQENQLTFLVSWWAFRAEGTCPAPASGRPWGG